MGAFNKGRQARTVKLRKRGDSITGVVAGVDVDFAMTFTADGRPDGVRYDANNNPVKTTTVILAIPDEKGDPTAEQVKLRIGDVIFTDRGRPNGMGTTSGLAVAISDAVEAAGLDDLPVGSTLTVVYADDDDEDATDERSAQKVYDATVEPA